MTKNPKENSNGTKWHDDVSVIPTKNDETKKLGTKIYPRFSIKYVRVTHKGKNTLGSVSQVWKMFSFEHANDKNDSQKLNECTRCSDKMSGNVQRLHCCFLSYIRFLRDMWQMNFSKRNDIGLNSRYNEKQTFAGKSIGCLCIPLNIGI